MSINPFPKKIVNTFIEDDYNFSQEPVYQEDLDDYIAKNGDLVNGSITFLSNNHFAGTDDFNNIIFQGTLNGITPTELSLYNSRITNNTSNISNNTNLINANALNISNNTIAISNLESELDTKGGLDEINTWSNTNTFTGAIVLNNNVRIGENAPLTENVPMNIRGVNIDSSCMGSVNGESIYNQFSFGKDRPFFFSTGAVNNTILYLSSSGGSSFLPNPDVSYTFKRQNGGLKIDNTYSGIDYTEDLLVVGNSKITGNLELGNLANVENSINTNSGLIASNTSSISLNSGLIASNTSNITSNTSNIATNTTNITSNTSNIATNTTNIGLNSASIASNTSNIATNTTNIGLNSASIASNTSNIATNTSNIATNTTNIGLNSASIASNTSNITSNTSNIATNTIAISNLETEVDTKAGLTTINTFTNTNTFLGATVLNSNVRIGTNRPLKQGVPITLNNNSVLDTSCNGTIGGEAVYNQISMGARELFIAQGQNNNEHNYIGTSGSGGNDPDFHLIYKRGGYLKINSNLSNDDFTENFFCQGTAKITGNLGLGNLANVENSINTNSTSIINNAQKLTDVSYLNNTTNINNDFTINNRLYSCNDFSFSSSLTQINVQPSTGYNSIGTFTVNTKSTQFDFNINIVRAYYDADYPDTNYYEYDQFIRIKDENGNIVASKNTTINQNYIYSIGTYHTAVPLNITGTITTPNDKISYIYYVEASVLDTANIFAIESIYNYTNASSITLTENTKYNPISQGVIKTNIVNCNQIYSPNANFDNIFYKNKAGIILFDGIASSSTQFPIFKSSNLDQLCNQEPLGSNVSTSVNGTAIGYYDRFNIGNILDFVLVYPKYGIISYTDSNYSGAIILNYNNDTQYPQVVKMLLTNQCESVKIYYNRVEIV